MRFGDLLKRERERSGFSQQALAAKCAVSSVYIYRLEKKGIDPPARKMCRTLAKAMQIDEKILWEPALKFRLRRWLAKEGYSDISENQVDKIVETLENG